jgi:hypothetical protein
MRDKDAGAVLKRKKSVSQLLEATEKGKEKLTRGTND